MSNDPLARSDIWAGALNETEYDAVYASVTATDRGRWFLSEYANRNRHANTDLVVAAIVRIESAIHGEAGQNSTSGATDRTPGVVAAVERISDIAIGLRERGADAALCDALDAAVREISGLDTAIQPHEAAVVPISEKASASVIDDEPLPEAAFFDMELQESKKFADAVAALAASLASPGDEPTESAGSQSETLEVAAPPHDFELKSEPEFEPESEPKSEPAPSELQVQSPRWRIEGPDFVFHPSHRPASTGDAAAPDPLVEAESFLPHAQLQADPEEDPADLFVSEPDQAVFIPIVAPAAEDPPPQPPAVKSVMRPAPRPVSDPLAAMRALSEDELTALFG
jgi:hypothetical protein